jgi:hypothetical protein
MFEISRPHYDGFDSTAGFSAASCATGCYKCVLPPPFRPSSCDDPNGYCQQNCCGSPAGCGAGSGGGGGGGSGSGSGGGGGGTVLASIPWGPLILTGAVLGGGYLLYKGGVFDALFKKKGRRATA